MSTLAKKQKRNKQFRKRFRRSGIYYSGGKEYRGRLPNGRISFNLKENSHCVELAKMGISHQVIADNLGLTVNQVVYRLNKIGISVMDYRRGESPESKVVLNRFKVTYKI